MVSVRKIMSFWNTEAGKYILLDAKNKILNIQNESLNGFYPPVLSL